MALFPFFRVAGQPPLVRLTEARTEYSLGMNVEYLADSAGAQTLANVQDSHRFLRSRQQVPSFGFSDSVYWFRCRLRNDATDADVRWLLELGYSHFRTIDLYAFDTSGQLISQQLAGNSRGSRHRPLATHNYVFPLRLAAGQEVTLYLRCDAMASKLFPLTIYEQHAFYDQAQTKSLWIGFYFGFLVVIILYHLFIFLYSRAQNTSYLLFSLYLFAYFLNELLRSNGNYIERLLLVYHPFWQQHVVALLNGVILLVSILGLRFYRVGLQLEKTNWLRTVLTRTMQFNLLLFGFLLTGLLPRSYSLLFNFLVPLTSYLAVLTVSLIRLRQGYHLAWYYFGGTLLLFSGVLFSFLNRAGWWPTMTFWAQNAIQIASVAEIILLSLGFGESMRAERRMKKLELEFSNLAGRKSEREWLSMVLHTSFGTSISSMLFELSRLNWSQFSTDNLHRLSDLRQQLTDSLSELRILARSLPPTLLDEQGLKAAFEGLIKNYNSRQQTRFHLMVSGEEKRLEARREFELYLIGLELVNNVMRHASATTAWLELTWEQNDWLTVRMRDNGQGIISQPTDAGHGLASIRRMVEHNLGGTVTVVNAPAGGTVVFMRLNLNGKTATQLPALAKYSPVRQLFGVVRSYF